MKSVFVVLTFIFLVLGVSACRIKTSPPELTAVSPKQAYVGQQITLSGYQFGSEPVVTFSISGIALAGKIVSSTEESIQVMIPPVPPGIAQVRVQTSEGIADPLPFTVLQPAPVLTTVTPGNGLPGTEVVVTGSYLNQVQEVRFEQTLATVKDSTAEKLTLLVPANMPHGPLNIVITTKGGVVTAGFIVAGTPQITSLSAKKAKRGAELVIQGVNLSDGIVRINGLGTDRSQTTIKDTEIHTIIPDNATSGLVTVTVFEKLIATSTDSLQIILTPAIANLSARDGITGDKIILTGQNLKDVTSVSFGTTPVTFRVLSDTQIEATVPALASSGAVTVSATSVGGIATAADQFFFYQAPSNLAFTPARLLRGQQVTITGKNLYRITQVQINGQAVSITSSIEGTQVIVNVPATGVSGLITVSNRAGTATSSQLLIVVQPAIITTVVPLKGRPGDRIVVQGNFLLNAQFFFTGSASPATDGGKNEDTERWILVPTDAQNGPIRVLNTSGVNTVTDTFTVIRLATITDFTPKTAQAGDVITITGQNLSSVTEVRFNGGTSAPAPFQLSGSSLLVTVPATAVAGQICLINTAGTACTTANFTPTK